MEQKQHQQVIIVPTHTILHPCLDFMAVKYFHEIPRSVCNINQEKQYLQIHHIFWTDYDHDYILKKSDLETRFITKEI